MIRARCLVAALAGTPLAAAAQTQMPAMPGMSMPASPSPAAPAAADDPPCPPEHARMGHCLPAAAASPAAATALPPGHAPAPAAPSPTYADRIWGSAAMAPSRAMLRREHGGGTFRQFMVNLAEVRPNGAHHGYRWDGEGRFGGDVDRLVVKSEGEGRSGAGAERAEVQALYSRAIGPYLDLQGGVRHDLIAGAPRTYATAAVEGLAPYWFQVEAALFLSDRGDLLGRVEGYTDLQITQRLVLQPRAEINLAAQDVPASRIGAGLADAELGLRLRYEIRREIAPYVGASWDRRSGASRRLEGSGEASGPVLVVGLRAWL